MLQLERFRDMFGYGLTARRLRRRFERVERVLRARDLSNLNADQQSARQQNLDRLHSYWITSRFPRNYDYPQQHKPCFIDRDGRVCAVAHLLIESGEVDLAQRIVANANYATIPQMQFPGLDDWAAQSGLSKDEIAFIQPRYPCEFNAMLTHLDGIAQGYASLAVLAGTIGLFSLVRNVQNLTQRRVGWLAALCGLAAGGGLLYLAILQPQLIAQMASTVPISSLSRVTQTSWASCPQLVFAQRYFASLYASGGVNWTYLFCGSVMAVLSFFKLLHDGLIHFTLKGSVHAN